MERAAQKNHLSTLGYVLSRKMQAVIAALSVVLCLVLGVLICDGRAQGELEPNDATLASESTLATRPLLSPPESLEALIHLMGDDSKSLDTLALNLAIAKEVPSLRSLDVSKFQLVLDKWADHVRSEVQRNLYRFHASPKDFNSSQAYFTAMMLCTVVGQDFQVRYDQSGFSFEKPEDLFVHGVINNRRGTCISLPVLYVALGQRLGYPIREI